MAHYDIFRDQLAIKYPEYGHALWEPSPRRPDRPVEVGDVGFIRRGKFIRLFNALLPTDDPSHELGVPEYHEQLVPDMLDHIIRGSLGCNHYCSAGISIERELDIHASGPPDDSDFRRVSFRCSKRYGGAVLSLPVKARREDTLALGDFAKCILTHIDTWFAFARGLGLGIQRMEEIILVTGFDRTRSWVNIAFSGGQDDAQVSFGVKAVGGLNSGVYFQFSPEDAQGGLLCQGPEGINRGLPENQCVFIRGYRVFQSRWPFPRHLKAAADPPPDPQGHDSDPGMELLSTPAMIQYRDPLYLLLDYIAKEAPDCNMIVVHDGDLGRIGGFEVGIPQETFQPDAMMDFLERSNIDIHKVDCDLSSNSLFANAGVVRVAMLSTVLQNRALFPLNLPEMAGISTVPTHEGDIKSPKASVVIVLTDSDVGPPSQPSNTIPYIDTLLSRLREANPRGPIYLGLVRYSPVRSHLSIIPITLVPVHNVPMKVPSSQVIPGSSYFPAFDGYMVALNIFDHVRSRRIPEKTDEEEFSCHLWHIATGDNGPVESENSAFLFWGWTWDNISFELKRHNIELSTILLSPCPRFSALFSAMSPEPVKPWFPTCPHHELLLSGFDAHSPSSDTAPPKALAKRPADTLVENISQNLKIEDSSQARNEPAVVSITPSTMPCQPTMPRTTPTVSQITAPDVTTHLPVHKAQYIADGYDQLVWKGKLIWFYEGSDVWASVQATYPIGDSRTRMWPTTLQLEIIESGMSTLDIQKWITKLKAPVARIQCTPGMECHNFDLLVETLRRGRCVAVARRETQNKDTSSSVLVLSPLGKDILCATFLPSDLSKTGLQLPQQETKPKADQAHPADSLSQTAMFLQGEDLDNNQTGAFESAVTLVSSVSPQQTLAQQDERRVSLNAQVALADALVPWSNNPLLTSENAASANFDPIDSHVGRLGVDSNLYGDRMYVDVIDPK